MIKNIRFYKEFDLWFADIPEYIQEGGQLADLQMVCGADTWLDILSDNDEITLIIGFGERIENEDGRLLNIDVDYGENGNYLLYPQLGRIWLCPVLKWLTGGYPDIIYYKIVKK